MSTVKAWHWLPDDGRLAHPHNGEKLTVQVGQTLECDSTRLDLCRYGLHASTRLIDALGYAQGGILCRVQMGGTIVYGKDKLVASRRTVIALADATRVLHEFAYWCTERALLTVGSPDPRSLNAITVKRKWLNGEASDQELCDAMAAARDAARDAASAASSAASWTAAWTASRAAAWTASSATSWTSAKTASRAASSAVVWDAQNRKLTSMVRALLKSQSRAKL